MKNKKMLYILVPAVILIWGAVIFSILSHVGGSGANYKPQNMQMQTRALDIDSNKYQLLANYRDPFHAGIRTTSIDNDMLQKNDKQKTEKSINWPQITYYGLIINNKKPVALLKVNNSNLLMHEGEEKENLTLKKLYPDSIILNYQKNKKTFFKMHTNSLN
jgi:hypothetical protein